MRNQGSKCFLQQYYLLHVHREIIGFRDSEVLFFSLKLVKEFDKARRQGEGKHEAGPAAKEAVSQFFLLRCIKCVSLCRKFLDREEKRIVLS